MGSRRRRMWAPLGAALALLGLGACDPATFPMEIQVSLHRDGLIGSPDGSGFRTLVLTGVSQCTRDEPVDLFPTVTQGATSDRPSELSVPCGPDRHEWTASFRVVDTIQPGTVRVDVQACTNPGEPIDEDCVDLGRGVSLGAVP